MARLPRLTLPGHLHHVIQRGNNRQPIFQDGEDFHTMLALLADNALQHGVAVHASVLLDNHFHLLVTPPSADALPQMMQAVGRRYVQYFNRRHARTGTLWEGRYRGTLLQAEQWLLPTMVSMDLNPVRAGLVHRALDWPWSSYAHSAGIQHDGLISPHALFWALGNTPFARDAAYVRAVEAGLDPDTQEQISHAALRGWALGEPDFIENLQQKTERRVKRQKAGRPAARTASVHED